jgi:exonuclease VII small subunit
MKKAFNLILVGMLLFGMIAAANTTDPVSEAKAKQYEYLKKAKYFEIRAELEAGKITLEEAQAKWQKAINKLKKEEGK